MAYALPTNVTGMGELFQYIVSVDGNFFNLLLISIGILIFLVMDSSGNPKRDSIMTASFGVFLLAVLLNILNLVSSLAIFIPLVLAGISIVIRD